MPPALPAPASVRVTVIAHTLIRIESAPDGRFVDVPSLFAIHGPTGSVPLDDPVLAVHTTPASAGSPPIRVSTDRLSFIYTPDGQPPHPGNMHALIRHPAPPAGLPMLDGHVLWTPGARNRFNLGGTLSTLDGLRAAAPLPEGLLSRDGWQLVDDSATAVLVDGWAATRESVGAAANLDWYLFAYGNDFPAALRTLAIIAGVVPTPRKYALGSWFSRYWPYTSEEFRGIALEYASHGFPLDVMVLDMDWHREGWTGWSWNRDLLPDAETLMQWLHAQSLAVTLNLHPADGVGPHEDRYAPFMRALGRTPDGSTVAFDAGDRDYMQALFGQVHRPLEQPERRPGVRGGAGGGGAAGGGIDFWWLDWQQDRFVRSIPGLTNLRWLNHLYTNHTQRQPGTLGPADPGLRPLSFSRWGGGNGESDREGGGTPFGDHRNPVHFSGDAHTGWDMLAFQVPFTVTAGNVGCFFWSHDIGGHFGPRFEETTARWVQFGALSPVLRLHSARTASLDRRPWTYEPRFSNAMRTAFLLRSRLMPTIYAAARECEEMLPLLRPMYLTRPGTPRAYRTPHQYTLGDHLLCAPITAPGLGQACVGTQYVWFPADEAPGKPPSAWHDLSTGSRFGGDNADEHGGLGGVDGAEAIVSAPIDRSPVYLRAGVPLAMQGPTLRMAAPAVTDLRVRMFPGRPGQRESTNLYEDDGASLAYRSGASAATPITVEWSTRPAPDGRLCCRVDIGPTTGIFEGQQPERRIAIEVAAVAEVQDVQVDNTPASATPTTTLSPRDAGGLFTIDLGIRPISRLVSVEFTLRPADAAALALAERAADLAAALDEPVKPETLVQTVVRHCAPRMGAVGEARGAATPNPARIEAILRIGAGIGAFSQDHILRVLNTLGLLDDDGPVDVHVIDRVGTHETPLSRHAVQPRPNAPADVILPPAPLAAPPLGLRATRLVRVHASIRRTPIVFEHVLDTHLAPLTAFACAGPFDWDWRWSIAERVNAPETLTVDPHAGTQTPSTPPKAGWTPAKSSGKWAVNFRELWADRGGLGYAAVCILSPVPQPVRIHFECSDKLEAFLDGAKVYSLDAFDGHAAAQPSAAVTLPKGESVLLVKASQGGGGWGFTASIDAPHGLEQRPL